VECLIFMQHPFYLTALALTFIFSFVLGVFTILLNPKSRTHQLWFLTTMGVALWSGALFAFVFLNSNEKLGIFLAQILHIGSTLIVIFFYNFLAVFLLKWREYKISVILCDIFSLIFLVIIIFMPQIFVKGIIPRAGFAKWIDYGSFYWPYFFYYIIFVLLSARILLKEFFKSDGIRKKQILYILLALVIGFSGGLTNFFPALFNIYPFGTFVIFLYPILITYGMFLPQVKIKF